MSGPAGVEDLMVLVVSLREELMNATKQIAALSSRVVDLEAQNAQLRADNEQLRAENARLRGEVERLRARVGMDSSNSSRPPSSDGPGAWF